MTGSGPGPASDTGAESDSEGNAESEGEPHHTARAHPRNVTIEAPPVETAEYLATWWVSLADEQRVYDSHLLGEPNQALIREAMARHIVTDGLLVARVVRRNGGNDGDERSTTGRSSSADDGVIVGFVMFGPETGSYEQSVDRGIIENVYVHPDYRNRDIGGALLDAAERALAESGVDVIALEAMADNEAARRLYARRGYSPHRVELEAPVSRLSAARQGNDASEDGPSGDREPESNRKR